MTNFTSPFLLSHTTNSHFLWHTGQHKVPEHTGALILVGLAKGELTSTVPLLLVTGHCHPSNCNTPAVSVFDAQVIAVFATPAISVFDTQVITVFDTPAMTTFSTPR